MPAKPITTVKFLINKPLQKETATKKKMKKIHYSVLPHIKSNLNYIITDV